ncbi:putative defense protein 3 isoform X2 [Dysidea avara]|uniref:putative defense protein 3 isoform X2 n=1 Tax=Dysidea avara TaxID=196820 RepID=UPI003330A2BB
MTVHSKVSFNYAILLSCALLITVVNSRSSGAPEDACGTTTDIVPGHTGSPQTSPVPYTVDLSTLTGMMYTPGQTYTITMRGGSDPNFRGFMIQGRVVADDSRTGMFASSGTNYQERCSNTAATHTNANEKTSVALSWTAPPAGTGPIRFRYAFVEAFATYWANIVTDTINEEVCNVERITITGVSVAGGTVTVQFSSDTNARFRCKLNSQRYRQCTSPVTYTGLSPGRYRVTLRAACPGQRLRDGARKRAHFRVRA